MSYQIEGAIVSISPTEVVGTSGFQKRKFAIEVHDGRDGMYNQTNEIEFIKDKCSILDQYALGDMVLVNFNLNGRAWVSPQGETKYFNTLQAWKIEKKTQPGQVAPQQQQLQQPQTTAQASFHQPQQQLPPQQPVQQQLPPGTQPLPF